MSGKRLYVIAGEASGDLHGANFLKALRAKDPTIEVRAWGGDRMQAEGAHIVKHYRELAFMGFAEVVMNLRTILRNISVCKEDIAEWKPDALVLIDYPGFNLRIAEWAHEQGIKVLYYISPQIWAWKKGRVHKIKRVVDRMFTILPFEKEFYAQYGMDAEFVGHPLLDEISGSTVLTSPSPWKRGQGGEVALLPGSRRQEIGTMLPVMLDVAKRFPGERFVVAAAPSVPRSYYEEMMKGSDAQLVIGDTYGVLRKSKAALVTSGTATLETALFGVPMAVCYKGSAVNVWLAKRLVKVKYISLVNLIMDKPVVQELIQEYMNERVLSAELERLLHDEEYIRDMHRDMADLLHVLGGAGASARVADGVWKSLNGVA
ncbi:MAG: lipid-A-disaccharide synthase [Flavobacteriales bacterium]